MKNITPLKAIRQKCLECSESAKEVKLCQCTDCPLWTFRMGFGPKKHGMVNPGAFLKKTGHLPGDLGKSGHCSAGIDQLKEVSSCIGG